MWVCGSLPTVAGPLLIFREEVVVLEPPEHEELTSAILLAEGLTLYPASDKTGLW